MAYQARVLRVVVASPADVRAEREAVRPVLDKLNRTMAADRGLRLEPVYWETDSHPGFHVDGPQGLIDSLLKIEDCDVLIGIFWKRFGTPVKDAGSGTEHEIRLAYECWKAHKRPQIMVYYNQKPCNLKTIPELEQRARVVKFFDQFPQEGLWHSYNGVREFKEHLGTHLENWLRSSFPPEGQVGSGAVAPQPGNASPSQFLAIGETSVSLSPSVPANVVALNPVILWRAFPPAKAMDVFRLLDWRVRATPLIGRENDLEELIRWAYSEPKILVRFLVGAGGAGKTRLAFEAADQLKTEGWSAGQIFLDRSSTMPLAGKGLFLVVDYPEACRGQLQILLRDLARIENDGLPIRVLLLSRLPIKEWHPLIDAATAGSICDAQELKIGPLEPAAGLRLFRAASERFAAHAMEAPPDHSDEMVLTWLAESPTQGLPIFIVAAALHSVMMRSPELSLTGAQIASALVRREMLRLDNAGRAAGCGGHCASRVVGLAAVADGLNSAAISRLAEYPGFGLPSQRPVDAIKAMHLWEGNRVPPPTPDIVAAAFLYEVLSDSPEDASEWLWASLADSATANVAGMGRVAFDIGTLHGPDKLVRFADWLAKSVAGEPSRALQWREIFDQKTPIGVTRLAVAIGRCLLNAKEISPFDRASILRNLSQRLTETGELAEGLRLSAEAAAILSELAEQDPQTYSAELARALTTQAMCMRICKKPGAGASIAENAVEIWRSLSKDAPERYEPDSAESLRVWSDCLGEDGQLQRAAELTQHAVEIWRKLAATNARQYEPSLARTLNSLSVDLWQCDDREGSTKAIHESVKIWQRLVEENPGMYEPEFALALSNQSRNLTAHAGDTKEAMSTLKQAIRIYSVVVSANPARYGLYLAQSLDNLHRDLSKIGETRASIQALRESVAIKKKIAASDSFLFAPEAARSLERLSLELDSVKDEVDAAALLQALENAEKTVCILLVRGDSPKNERIFAYVAVFASRLEQFMLAQKQDMFYPEDFGKIIESGTGEPSPEVKQKMETEYGFNHQAMVDIPGVEKAAEIRRSLPESS
jgi:tetratricopeptide (TPR) repeat protein